MKQAVESAVSYTVAGGGLLVGLAEDAKALTIIVALLIGVVRLAYDAVRFYRYMRKENKE